MRLAAIVLTSLLILCFGCGSPDVEAASQPAPGGVPDEQDDMRLGRKVRIGRGVALGTELSRPAASISGYSSTKYLRQIAAGLADMDSSRFLNIIWQQRGMADETVFAYHRAARGYFLNHNGSGDYRFFDTGQGTNRSINGAIRRVTNNALLFRRADGSLWSSLNGGAATQIATTANMAGYVQGDGTTELILGRSQSAVGTSAAVNVRHIAVAWGKTVADFTTAEMSRITDRVNKADRNHLHPLVRARILEFGGWELDVERDVAVGWNGLTSITSGLGNSPITLASAGTALTRDAIEALVAYSFDFTAFHNGANQAVAIAPQGGGQAYTMGLPFRRVKFTTNALDMTVRDIIDWTGINFMDSVLVKVDGVVKGNTGTAEAGLRDELGASIYRNQDVFAMGAGTKTVEIIEGAQALVGGVVGGTSRGHCVTQVLLAKSATFDLVEPVIPEHSFGFEGDSILVGLTPTISEITQGIQGLITADYPGTPDSTFGGGAGSNTWYRIANDATARAITKARWSASDCGTTTKRRLIWLGRNDWWFWNICWGTASDRPTFRAAVKTLLTEYRAERPDVTLHVYTPIQDANDTTLVPATTGVSLPTVRTDLITVLDEIIADEIVALGAAGVFKHTGNDILLSPPSADYADNTHPTPAGQAKMKARVKTNSAAAADAVGGGTGY